MSTTDIKKNKIENTADVIEQADVNNDENKALTDEELKDVAGGAFGTTDKIRKYVPKYC